VPTCRCPSCSELVEVHASAFGNEQACPTCGRIHTWDVEQLARFELVERVRVHLVESDGATWRGPAIPLFISHSAELPPLWTSAAGLLRVERETIELAERVEYEADMMGRRGDPALVRFVEARTRSRADAAERAELRMRSGWPLTRLEQRYYASMDALVAAYRPPVGLELAPSLVRIDLETRVGDIELRVTATRS
jgi:hypothetical protein